MRKRNKGISVIYMVLYMVVLCAFCSLGVDFGRVQIAKTELRRATDAAARAGAAGIPIDTSTAIAYAMQYAAKNKVDGTPLVLVPGQDIEFGKWDVTNATFTRDNGSVTINSIHITSRRSVARGNAVPMMFMSLLGFNECNVTAESIVMVVPPLSVDQNVQATANPFLSAMPEGSVASRINPHRNPDFAGNSGTPKASPQTVSIPLVEGDVLTFDSIEGTARHDPNLAYFNPDGELADIGHNNVSTNHMNNYGSTMYNENGIADMWSPINALVGVFIDDNAPSTTSTPTNLDFRTGASRDFSILKPEQKQIFFIGDGSNSSNAKQQFIVPKGATRLYLATWDFYEWNNNAGYRQVKVNRPMRIITVK